MSSSEGSSRRSPSLEKQRAEQTQEDRISELPDALLIKILSLFPLTQYAMRTCILSKRWLYLCYSIFNFHFDSTTIRNFIPFVDYVLTRSTCSKIKTFHLRVAFPSKWVFKISEWLCFSVENKVEHLALLSHSSEDVNYLPLSMSTCSSLISLDLTRWWFAKDSVLAWNSLKSLELTEVGLDDDDVVKLLSSCPALETLQVTVWGDFHCFDTTSSNLKKLKFSSYGWFENDVSMQIIAPHLQHLELTEISKCRLANVSSLVTATLTFYISCINDEEDYVEEAESCHELHQVSRNLVVDYIQKLSSVAELRFGRWFAKVLFMLQLEGMPLPELRWKCLTL